MSENRVAYQATDLARNHREVIDAARRGEALIRDKDGTALVLAPAAELGRIREISSIALDLLRAQRAADSSDRGDPTRYGDLAWISVLPEASQRDFAREMTDALLLAASGTSVRPVEVLIGDWRATAEAWADSDTRERLLADEPQPSGTELDA